jgi:hypothetical protein
MRQAVDVAVRTAVFVAVWLAWPDSATSAPTDPGTGSGWLLFVVIALVALLWGVVDGLLARGSLTRPLLTWAVTAPATAVLVPLVGGVAEGSWPAGVDTLRWVVALTLMFYFNLVLPAGLGVAAGSSVQGLSRWPSRG